MVNLVKMQDMLKNLSDDVIKAQLTTPTGKVPSFLLAAELARRDVMRAESLNLPRKTVSEDLVAPPPTGPAPQLMAGAPAASTPNMAAPPATGTAPQLMAGAPTPGLRGLVTARKGGVVRMADAGAVPRAVTWWDRITGDYPLGSPEQINQERRVLPGQLLEAHGAALRAEHARARLVAGTAAQTAVDANTAGMRRDLTNLQYPSSGEPGSIVQENQPLPLPPPITAAPVAASVDTDSWGNPTFTRDPLRAPDSWGHEVGPGAVGTARRAVALRGPPAGGGGGPAGGGPAGGGGAGGGGPNSPGAASAGGYGGAPAGGGGPQSPGAALVIAAADAAQKKYDEILKDSKPDVKQRKEDANARFLVDFGFGLLVNESAPGLAGGLHALGKAGKPALKGWEESNKSLREDMRNYAKDTLAGLKDDLAARVRAGEITQDHANKLLADATQRMDIAARATASAKSDASAMERLRISERGIDARATVAANRDALNAAKTDLQQAQVYERDLLKQQADLRNEGTPVKPEASWWGPPDPRKMAAYNNHVLRSAALDKQVLAAIAARAEAQKNVNARARLPGNGDLNYDPDAHTLTPAR